MSAIGSNYSPAIPARETMNRSLRPKLCPLTSTLLFYLSDSRLALHKPSSKTPKPRSGKPSPPLGQSSESKSNSPTPTPRKLSPSHPAPLPNLGTQTNPSTPTLFSLLAAPLPKTSTAKNNTWQTNPATSSHWSISAMTSSPHQTQPPVTRTTNSGSPVMHSPHLAPLQPSSFLCRLTKVNRLSSSSCASLSPTQNRNIWLISRFS